MEGGGKEAGDGGRDEYSGLSWEVVDAADVELLDRLSDAGGFAMVYTGRWRRQRVAVKAVVDPRPSEENIEEFMSELEVHAALEHRNIVPLLAAATKPPKLLILMELAQSSLFSRLHVSTDSISNKRLLGMALDVATGVEYLHTRKPPIIHRDLKSHNVLIASDGRCQLCDFGLASTKRDTAGTPAYMPPELLRVGGSCTAAVDVYALGILLWEMFCREVPLDGMTVAEIRDFTLDGNRPALPLFMDDAIKRLIEKCWAQDAKERASIAEVCDELDWLYREAEDSSRAERLASAGSGDALDALMGL
eukprot:PLAT15585.1.p1 GENE.PLAT15585.1~~PLAT15585.1.p1  ORF type:complete len:306 (+),score=159.92 PLAT15585.1:84-1001(+)